MKLIFLISLAFIFLADISFAQDTIEKRTGERVPVLIKSINHDIYYFKKYNESDSMVYSLTIEDINSVTFRNGIIHVFHYEPSTEIYKQMTDSDKFKLGRTDAIQYYKGYKSAKTGTFFSACLATPIGGLITGIPCDQTKPKDRNMYFPSETLKHDTSYYNGYAMQAQKIKRKKVWTGFGVGSAINVVVLLTIGAIIASSIGDIGAI